MTGGRRPWAVHDPVAQIDMQRYLADQCVVRFPDAATRDAQWPTPPAGAHCVVGEQLQERVGNVWWPTFGVIDEVFRSTDITGLTVGSTWFLNSPGQLQIEATIPDANRWVKVEFSCESLYTTTHDGYAIARLYDGIGIPGYIASQNVITNGAGVGTGVHLERIYKPGALHVFWTVVVRPLLGTHILSATGAPAELRVTDMGTS